MGSDRAAENCGSFAFLVSVNVVRQTVFQNRGGAVLSLFMWEKNKESKSSHDSFWFSV